MTVPAVGRNTGKENKIIITDDKDRLAKGDIEQLTKEAEKLNVDDDKQKK